MWMWHKFFFPRIIFTMSLSSEPSRWSPFSVHVLQEKYYKIKETWLLHSNISSYNSTNTCNMYLHLNQSKKLFTCPSRSSRSCLSRSQSHIQFEADLFLDFLPRKIEVRDSALSGMKLWFWIVPVSCQLLLQNL